MDNQNEPIVIYGTTWCPDCQRAKTFFGEHRVYYSWVDVDRDAEALAHIEKLNNGSRSVPTIVFPDGDIMVEPSNEELATKLELNLKASRSYYDTIIIGGGPTGLTSAVYTTREGLDTLVIERGAMGGQIGDSTTVDNFPGFDEGISGEELSQRLVRQATRFGTEILEATSVSNIERRGQYNVVTTGTGDEYTAKTVLIATGSRYRKLNVPGEKDLIGINVHFCATCDGAFYKDKDVLVIGGGNSGFEEGMFLTKFARHVRIVEFLPKVNASRILQEKVERRDDMDVVTNHAVTEFKIGDDGRMAGVVVENRETGETETWDYDGAFVFIGLEPNTGFLPETIERDQYGFLTTDATLQTSIEGIYAAGDVRAGSTKQVVAAAGEGATAALMIRQYMETLGDAPEANVEAQAEAVAGTD